MGVAGLLLLLVAVDQIQPPETQWTAAILLGGIDFYQAHLSERLNTGCPFTPTCSVYTEMAIKKYGAVKGGLMGAWRILRCNPWNTRVGEDYP
ncbi:membrane protein insertion efficiency factor YidD [bacterium]|nr:membrane protein insertion efficiency factor YidD [bacterium]MCB9478394.1 membrane protein insertion efficiency factor YidD [Deltaproteobacteria bacterium]